MNVFLVLQTLLVTHSQGQREYKKALDFLNRRVKLARSILGRTYSMHPLRNAFDGVPFGANKHEATLNPFHSPFVLCTIQ
jgi:hypothetical protein